MPKCRGVCHAARSQALPLAQSRTPRTRTAGTASLPRLTMTHQAAARRAQQRPGATRSCVLKIVKLVEQMGKRTKSEQPLAAGGTLVARWWHAGGTVVARWWHAMWSVSYLYSTKMGTSYANLRPLREGGREGEAAPILGCQKCQLLNCVLSGALLGYARATAPSRRARTTR